MERHREKMTQRTRDRERERERERETDSNFALPSAPHNNLPSYSFLDLKLPPPPYGAPLVS